MQLFKTGKFQVLIPHPLCDPTEFGSLGDLYGIYGRDGYLGGLRLLQVSLQSSFSLVTSLAVGIEVYLLSTNYAS